MTIKIVDGELRLAQDDGTVITYELSQVSVVPPTPPKPATLIGVTLTQGEMATNATAYPGNAVTAIYTPQGKGFYGWSNAAMKAAAAAKIKCIWASLKDTPTEALLNPVLDGIPPGMIFRLTFHHEPEQQTGGDPDLATYQRDWKVGRQIVDAHPKRDQIVLSEVLTQYAETHGKGPWDKWWTGQADELGWDCYGNAISTTVYPSAEAQFALPVAVTKTLKLPWAVREYGIAKLSTDTTGVQHTNTVGAHLAHVIDNDCAAIIEFNEIGTSGDYRLDVVPGTKAFWLAAMKNQPHPK